MGKDNPGVASCLLFNLFEENVEIAWVPRVRCTVVINMYQWIVLHIKLTHRLVDPAWRTSNGGLSFFLSVMWIPPYLYSCVYLRNKHSLSLSSPRWMRRHGDVLHLHVSAAATSWRFKKSSIEVGPYLPIIHCNNWRTEIHRKREWNCSKYIRRM